MAEPKYVLVVEKDEEIRNSIIEALQEKTDFKIIPASDGVTAYQKCRNQAFAVVISEYNLPKISGSQFLIAMRESNHNLHTPIIFYTSEVEDAKVSTRGTRNIHYFEKPTDIEKIVDKAIEFSKIDPEKKRFRLDVDFINPFIDTSVKTLNALCGVNDIQADKPMLLEDQKLDIDISGTLAITSPYFRGSIAISFNDKIYQSILWRMMEECVEDVTIDNQSSIAEIINIIFGQTKAVLNQRGYSLDRAIPSVVRGREHTALNHDNIPVLIVPFHSDLGDFWIQICVKAI